MGLIIAGMKKRAAGQQVAKRPRRSAEEWRKEAESWRASGQSARDYATAHGIHAATLTYWARRLGVSAARPAGAKRAGWPRSDRGRDVSAFLPVSVVSQSSEEAPPKSGTMASRLTAELELGGGRRLRLSGLEDLRELADLVTTLEKRLSC